MRWQLTLIFLILIGTLKAQNPTVELDTLIEVTARKLEERPSFSSIDRKGIDKVNQVNVQNVLNQVPGVFMHSGTLSTNRITIRGVGNRSLFSTAKIRAYLNEIPLTSGIGETSLEDIDLTLIDGIEIWKGPTASRYGAGLGGLIHYQAVDLPKGENVSSTVATQLSFGSFGLVRNTNELKLAVNEKLSIAINNNTTSTKGWRQNSNYKRQGAALLADYASDKIDLDFLFNFIDLNGQIPSSLNRTDFDEAPEKAAFTWNQVEGFEDYQKILAGIGLKTKGKGPWNISSALSYNRRGGYESRPFNILEDTSDAFTARMSLERSSDRSILKVGFETFGENYRWTTFETDLGVQGDLLQAFNEKRSYTNVFSEFSISASEKLKIEGGLNLNRTQYKLNDPPPDLLENYAFDWVLSPSLNFRFQPTPLSQFYITTSHGLSVPSLEETLTPDGLVNESISPEKGWNFEVGNRSSSRNGKFYIDLSIYNMIISDLLVTRFEPDIITGLDQLISVNAGNTNHFGVDVQSNFELLNKNESQLLLSTSYSYQNYRFKNFIDEDEDYTGNTLTGTIPNRMFSSLDYNIKNFEASLIYQFVDRMPMRDDNSIFSDSYSLMHIKLKYNLPLGEKVDLSLATGINNLTDSSYASMILINAGSFGGNLPRYYYPGNPRNYYANFRLSFAID